MRAQQAKLKSCKDDMTIAPGKRGTSAARGPEHKIISLFSLLVGAQQARQPEEKKRCWVWGRLPRPAVALLLCPDTLSKVIHGRAERAFGAERSEAVNNFAEMNFE